MQSALRKSQQNFLAQPNMAYDLSIDRARPTAKCHFSIEHLCVVRLHSPGSGDIHPKQVLRHKYYTNRIAFFDDKTLSFQRDMHLNMPLRIFWFMQQTQIHTYRQYFIGQLEINLANAHV